MIKSVYNTLFIYLDIIWFIIFVSFIDISFFDIFDKYKSSVDFSGITIYDFVEKSIMIKIYILKYAKKLNIIFFKEKKF